ncbi:hypothetical protein H8E77_36575 [bacterium]|nr:hypothetical protein [bacterium]
MKDFNVIVTSICEEVKEIAHKLGLFSFRISETYQGAGKRNDPKLAAIPLDKGCYLCYTLPRRGDSYEKCSCHISRPTLYLCFRRCATVDKSRYPIIRSKNDEASGHCDRYR